MLKALLVGVIVAASSTIAVAQSALPVGSIIAYSGASAPAGWLLCNGEPVPAGSQFNPLRALIGAKTPDLRGYFLRGLDPTGNVDPDSKTKPRTLLSVEPDGVGPHSHSYSRAFHNVAGKSGADQPDLPGDIDTSQTGQNASPGETRPKNMAVNFIIKATR